MSYARLLTLLVVLGAAACSSTTNNTSGTSADGGGSGAASGGDCTSRCVSYQAKCGNGNAQSDCQKLCSSTKPTEAQIECLEASQCSDATALQRCLGGSSAGGGLGCTAGHNPCNSVYDCPSSQGCNKKTGHCFDVSANCVGTPCGEVYDCPSGETCNSAAGSCN